MLDQAVPFPSEATRILSTVRPNTTFLTVHHYMNNYGEISDFSICFHVNYINAVKRAKKLLEEYMPSRNDCLKKPYSIDHLSRARDELIYSYGNTLKGNNPEATSAHAYSEIKHANEIIPGIKLHNNQDIIHLWGFKLHKRIIMPGTYPIDNRMPKTIAKDDLRNRTPLGNFTQYKLTEGKFYKLVVEGLTIKEEDVIRDRFAELRKVQ